MIGALAVAACGGSSNTSNQTGGGQSTVTRTVTQPVTSTTVDHVHRAAHEHHRDADDDDQASRDACNASDLTPVYLGSNGAAGTIVLGFALKNTGSTTCHTYGWPGVQFLSSSGAALPTGSVRTTGDVVGSTPASALTPGAR